MVTLLSALVSQCCHGPDPGLHAEVGGGQAGEEPGDAGQECEQLLDQSGGRAV